MTCFKTRFCVIVPAAAIIAAAGLTAPAGAAASTYRIVAATGDAAPGGGTFDWFGAPKMGNNGRVAFQSGLNSEVNPTGVWSEGASGVNSLELVIRQGDALPGVGGTMLGEIEPPFTTFWMNADGAIVFSAPIVGAQAAFGDDALLVHDGNGVDSVAVPGQIIDLGCQGFCQNHLTDVLSTAAINANGQVAFYSSVAGSGVSDDNDTAVLVGDANGLAVALREGDAPPNTWDVVYGSAQSNATLLHDNGEVTVRNYLKHNNGESYWTTMRGLPGDLGIMVAETWATPAGGEFGGGWFSFGNISANNAGDATFPQTVDYNEDLSYWGLWMHLDGATDVLVLEGHPAPEGHVFWLADTASARVNATGTIIYRAVIDGNGIDLDNDSILVRRWPNGSSQIIAQEGTPAPGFGPGVEFASFYGSQSAELTDSARVVFTALVEGPGIDDGNNRVMYVTRQLGEPVILLREGQKMLVNGEVKFVDSFSSPYGSGTESGRRAPITEVGQAAVRVTFTDDTEAVVVLTPPADCPGDADGDYDVDSADLNIILAAFGTTGDPGMPGDLDLDGDCDSADLNIVLAHFGEQCQPPA